jgi:hypothetical protein
VIDVGLRLDDVQAMQLESEAVHYGKSDPRPLLRDRGASEAEIRFLCHAMDGSGTFSGKRCELNAMTSGQFIAWLEEKLIAHGVMKVVPQEATLDRTYRENARERVAAAARQAAYDTFDLASVEVPDDLGAQVRALFVAEPTLAWTSAVAAIAERQHRSGGMVPTDDPQT